MDGDIGRIVAETFPVRQIPFQNPAEFPHRQLADNARTIRNLGVSVDFAFRFRRKGPNDERLPVRFQEQNNRVRLGKQISQGFESGMVNGIQVVLELCPDFVSVQLVERGFAVFGIGVEHVLCCKNGTGLRHRGAQDLSDCGPVGRASRTQDGNRAGRIPVRRIGKRRAVQPGKHQGNQRKRNREQKDAPPKRETYQETKDDEQDT